MPRDNGDPMGVGVSYERGTPVHQTQVYPQSALLVAPESPVASVCTFYLQCPHARELGAPNHPQVTLPAVSAAERTEVPRAIRTRVTRAWSRAWEEPRAAHAPAFEGLAFRVWSLGFGV